MTRINKYLADQKLCSRREADSLIKSGQVYINSKKASLGQKVSDTDLVELKRESRKKLERDRVYLIFNKPKGVVTVNPEKNQESIQSKLKLEKGIVPIGRLDKSSTGLILLSNDGRVTNKLLSPDSGHEKEYLVSVNKNISPSLIRHIEQGVVLEGGYRTKRAKAKKLSDKKLSITIREGKRHQIRRMLSVLGYETLSLKRIRIANLHLGPLKEGELKKLKGKELETFLSMLGL